MLYVSKFESDSTKSYTRVALNWVKALQTQNINFEVRPLDLVLDWSQMPEWSHDSKAYFSNTKSNMKCALIHVLPTDLVATKMYKSKKSTIGVTTFETSTLPLWLGASLNESFKGLIVPSEFNKKGLRASGVTIPIEVVPHALGDWWLQNRPTPSNKDPSVYTFGFCGNWNPRKNPETLLKAYVSAFPKNENKTALLLKTFGAPNITDLLPQSRDNSDIWFFNESWSENQMLWGFDMMDCYVSPHLGEGFGLTLAQAAAQGKPCIYTDFSAPQEWLSSECHFPISTNICDVAINAPLLSNTLLQSKGMQWAEPNFESLVDHLQNLAQTRPKFGFKDADLRSFRQNLCWESVGRRLVSAIESIMETPLEKKASELNEPQNTSK
jgi:glycosyltransferase involved in cell wall biosynthesis